MFEAAVDSEDFINRLKAGDEEAFKFLWIEGKRNVIRFLWWAKFRDAEDLWQDLWLDLNLTKCAAYELTEGEEFSKWLLTVAKNRARERERNRSRWPIAPIADIEDLEDLLQLRSLLAIEVGTPEQNNGGNQKRAEMLAQVLESLTEDEHELLHLKIDLGLKSPEIARRLGATSSAVRKRQSRLLRKLKKEILRLEDDELRRSHKDVTRGDSS